MRICVGALLVREEAILLGKRTAASDFYPDVWDVLGGHVEGDESREETLKRELQEEIGVVPIASRWLKTLHAPDPSGKGTELHMYLVVAWRGTPHNLCAEEHDEVRWFNVEEACCLPLAHPEYPALFQHATTAAHRHEGPDGG